MNLLQLVGHMSQSSFSYSKTPLNIESTQEALNMLRTLRQKRKKENPSSIYELVRSIYTFVKQNKKEEKIEAISAEQYLGTNRESIEDMLSFVKKQIVRLDRNQNPQAEQEQRQTVKLQKQIANHKQQIKRLNENIKAADQASKTLQIKLLNNIKRLDKELSDRNKQIIRLRSDLEQKNQQFASLIQLNEKQHKKIRCLEEEMYEIEMQLQSKNQELEAERQCADFLERKVSKFLTSDNIRRQQEERLQPKNSLAHEEKIQLLTHSHSRQNKFHQYGVQTEIENDQIGLKENEENVSQASKTISQSKESRHIESIERLTAQLGQAYQTINELMKKGESTSTREINNNQFHMSQQSMNIKKSSKSIISTNSEIESSGKKEKVKSKSGYFSKIWN